MKNKYKDFNADYTKLKSKMFFRLLLLIGIAFLIIFSLYIFIWRGNGADWLVAVFQQILKMDYQSALNLYQQVFRNNIDLIMITSIAVVFFVSLIFFLNWFTHYFNAINEGIEALLHETAAEISLPSEMAVTERKLNTVKQTLKQRELAVQLAEQRKNDLLMYLAHDIRTPLTSVIGYLSLLDEDPNMLPEQKAKYVHITLDKANRLEKMINEFFEITRYNLQQIVLSKETIDLYYMLVQLADELSPLLTANGNTAILNADENLTVYGDPDKLARVFNNVLKNATAYSYRNTDIVISAVAHDDFVIISFFNKGTTIPASKLSTIFEKFYRLDVARASDTGGAGLGLAIANEIVTLHGGAITLKSKDENIEFIISLPTAH